jgi:hypothetical protein
MARLLFLYFRGRINYAQAIEYVRQRGCGMEKAENIWKAAEERFLQGLVS